MTQSKHTPAYRVLDNNHWIALKGSEKACKSFINRAIDCEGFFRLQKHIGGGEYKTVEV